MAVVLCFYYIKSCNEIIGFGWLTLQPLAGSSGEPTARWLHALLSIIRPAFSSMNDCVQLKYVPYSGQITPWHCYGDTALCNSYCLLARGGLLSWAKPARHRQLHGRRKALHGLLPSQVWPSVISENPEKQEQWACPVTTVHRWLQGPLSERKITPCLLFLSYFPLLFALYTFFQWGNNIAARSQSHIHYIYSFLSHLFRLIPVFFCCLISVIL